MEKNTPAPTELPHNTIPGLSGEQADSFVEFAYANNRLRDKVGSSGLLEALDARDEMQVNNARLQRLANVAIGRPEFPVHVTLTDPEQPRRSPTLVVNPRDGRIVPYGQMQRGSYPRGGMIVRR